MAKRFTYYEGTTSANTILQDLSKVLCFAVKDNTGKVIVEENWDIVYPGINTNLSGYVAPVDKNNLSSEEFSVKINNQISQIGKKVILKTTTTPVELPNVTEDDLGLEVDLNVKAITLYVELYKPDYLLDPESYEPETERHGLYPRLNVYDMEKHDPYGSKATPFVKKLVRNNHFIYVRCFDEINITRDSNKRIIDASPIAEIKDGYTGNILETKSHISEWAKLCWYTDFVEENIDKYDADIGEQNISKGITINPCITPGINGDTRVRFSVNVNNNRFCMVIMGNPSIELSANKHLISMMYLGRIKSFKNSINDTSGNFAITTSSSTLPCKTVQKISSKIKQTKTMFLQEKNASNEYIYPYNICDGEKTNFFIPFEYAYEEGSLKVLVDGIEMDKSFYTIDCDLLSFNSYIPDVGARIDVSGNFYVPEIDVRPGVKRDIFGNIINIQYPDKYGKNTATCVSDVGMYHTRSKAYWQQHKVMFNTTEEYMTKVMYGKSSYTKKYYADDIKITHSNDGPRGMLDACLVIDNSSLVPQDDLVINRNFEDDPNAPEETYVFYPITAPFSPLSTGPNALYGIGLLKESKLPAPKDDDEAIDRILENLYIGRIGSLVSDIILPTADIYSAIITWETSDDVNLEIDEDGDECIGRVVRPAAGEPAIKVTLTATVKVGEKEKTKEFICTIIPEGLSAAQCVLEDKKWISEIMADVILADGIKTLPPLPIEGPNDTTIKWEFLDDSGNPVTTVKII